MKNILKNILTGVAAALIIVIIFIFLMTHISQSTYTENVVREYIESYSSDISPAEINVITKNLSNKIDNAILV